MSIWRSATAGKEKLVGIRENWIGIDELKSPEAPCNGVLPLSSNPGTRGIVNASTMPILRTKHSRQNALHGDGKREMDTHATMRPKPMKTHTLRVSHLHPSSPRWPRLNSFHCRERLSAFFSLLPALVMSRSSEAFHSGPSAGTVTISTGPTVLRSSSSLLGVPCGGSWW